MYEVRVNTDFAAAHFLKDYNGKCENLHGHNYKVYAHVKGLKLNEGGMLLDFTKLKQSLRKVCSFLDHTNLNDNSYFNNNPSAERIASYIFEQIILLLPELKFSGNKEEPYLFAVDVFETDSSRARFTIE